MSSLFWKGKTGPPHQIVLSSRAPPVIVERLPLQPGDSVRSSSGSAIGTVDWTAGKEVGISYGPGIGDKATFPVDGVTRIA